MSVESNPPGTALVISNTKFNTQSQLSTMQSAHVDEEIKHRGILDLYIAHIWTWLHSTFYCPSPSLPLHNL